MFFYAKNHHFRWSRIYFQLCGISSRRLQRWKLTHDIHCFFHHFSRRFCCRRWLPLTNSAIWSCWTPWNGEFCVSLRRRPPAIRPPPPPLSRTRRVDITTRTFLWAYTLCEAILWSWRGKSIPTKISFTPNSRRRWGTTTMVPCNACLCPNGTISPNNTRNSNRNRHRHRRQSSHR